MAEVNETVSFVGLFWLSVVHWNCKVVELAAVIHLKVLLDIVSRIPARYIADHEVCACLLAIDYPCIVKYTTIILPA